MSLINWDDFRFYLAVVRYKTLANAAKHLQVTQSTVRRRLAAFQDDLGVRLLSKSLDGYIPTQAGEGILSHIERVEAEARSVERAVMGMDARLGGVVRMAASNLLASHVVAPTLAAMQAHHPEITIELVPEADYASPSPGDADILLRLRRFDHPDLIVRSIGTLAFGLYCSPDYLAQHAQPDFDDACAGTKLVTLLEEREFSAQSAWLSENAREAVVAVRADSHDVQQAATRCSCGIALLARFRADADPGLCQLRVPIPIPPANIWIGVHRDSRALPRVRLVLDHVAEAVRLRSPELNPEHAGYIA